MAIISGGFLQISGTLAFWSIIATIAFIVGQLTYNVFFHPLRSYPGPLSMRATRLVIIAKTLRGTVAIEMLALHEKYGPVVRIAPNELAFAKPEAWKDIAGHQPKGDEIGKFVPFYRPSNVQRSDIISASREEHGLLRRQLAHGFSDRSMREQEPLIARYVDLLMQRLRENSGGASGRPVDMVMWFNCTTFDVIGDLALGEAFGCLEKSALDPWIKNFFVTVKMGTMMQCAVHYPMIKNLMIRMIPESFKREHTRHGEITAARVRKRMQWGKVRHDLIEGLLMKQDEWQMPVENIESHASLLIVAGSETTATLLSGATYLLLTHPEAMARLNEEVRSKFQSEKEITIESASRLPYLLACLDESLRLYPPVPTGLPRLVPKGGKTICGHFVPEDTIVGIHQRAAYRYSRNWTEPNEFHPERFLDDPKFAGDRREVLQPFSFGPRNCIGKNLAHAEMRIIMARLIFNFDLKLDEKSRDWMDTQKIFNLWRKPELLVHLTPRMSG